ncbi:MAG: hypothetical protein IT442_08945 [Phycisphaeraceae bacterium]|nr:hypothetical protein [Phycisphaeraceae bacterium]
MAEQQEQGRGRERLSLRLGRKGPDLPGEMHRYVAQFVRRYLPAAKHLRVEWDVGGITLRTPAGEAIRVEGVRPERAPRPDERAFYDSLRRFAGRRIRVGGRRVTIPGSFAKWRALPANVRRDVRRSRAVVAVGWYLCRQDRILLADYVMGAFELAPWVEEVFHAGYARLTAAERAAVERRFGCEEEAFACWWKRMRMEPDEGPLDEVGRILARVVDGRIFRRRLAEGARGRGG